jgi:hypothetical protein
VFWIRSQKLPVTKGTPLVAFLAQKPIMLSLYTRDEFFGALWLWAWQKHFTGEYRPINLKVHCPRCVMKLELGDWSPTNKGIRIICDKCNFEWKREDLSYVEIRNKVEREIIRMRDSDEWKERLRHQQKAEDDKRA